MADSDESEKILKANFKAKRPKPGAKPSAKRQNNLLQTRAAGIVVAVLLVAAILALNFALPTP